NAASYIIRRSTSPGGPYTEIARGVTGVSYTDRFVRDATAYAYIVAAENSSGLGANSIEASATPYGPPARAYLRFDATSGVSAVDSLLNGWADTILNCASWGCGRVSHS